MDAGRVLLLWDIDHTLIETGGVGRDLYAEAFRAATGRELMKPAKITGSTELRIFAETLDLHGIPATDDLRNRYATELAKAYRDGTRRLLAKGRALPGATEVLSAAGSAGYVQTVVTGNLRDVAESKVTIFELADHLDLDLGAYAEDAQDRAELVAIAVSRAERALGCRFDGHTIMIGDTPSDVRAGRDRGVPVIGVATGTTSQDDLAAAGAAATLPHLDVERFLAVVQQVMV